MKLDEFMEKHNHAPHELDEVAETAAQVTDNDTLAFAANAYLNAKSLLDSTLDDIGFEFG